MTNRLTTGQRNQCEFQALLDCCDTHPEPENEPVALASVRIVYEDADGKGTAFEVCEACAQHEEQKRLVRLRPGGDPGPVQGTTRLYYAYLIPRGFGPPDLTREDLEPDCDNYYDEDDRPLEVKGIRLTKEPDAADNDWMVIAVDVPLDSAALAAYRVQWDWKHESYDLPEEMVNSSRRTWVRDGPILKFFRRLQLGE